MTWKPHLSNQIAWISGRTHKGRWNYVTSQIDGHIERSIKQKIRDRVAFMSNPSLYALWDEVNL